MKCINVRCIVLPTMKYWINLSMVWSQLLSVRFLKRTYKPFKKPVYLPNKFCELQTWLVEVAHIVNSMNFQIMPQWNWIVWVLTRLVLNLIKVAKTFKPINLAQPALLMAKRATLPENAGTIPLDHPLLMLPTIHKDISDA